MLKRRLERKNLEQSRFFQRWRASRTFFIIVVRPLFEASPSFNNGSKEYPVASSSVGAVTWYPPKIPTVFTEAAAVFGVGRCLELQANDFYK